MSQLHRLRSALLAVSVSAIDGDVRAAPPLARRAQPTAGRWSAPSGCIQEAELMRRVQQQFPRGMLPEGRQVDGSVDTVEGGFVVHYQVSENDKFAGDRLIELSGSSCRDHDETMVFVYSLLLEHGSHDEPEQPQSPTQQSGPPKKQRAEPLARSNQEEPREFVTEPASSSSLRHWSFETDYSFVAGWTAAPVGGLGAELGLHLVGPVWLTVDGAFLPPTTKSTPFGQAQSWGGFVQAGACLSMWSRPRFELGSCITAGPYFLRARGREVDVQHNVAFQTLGVSARLTGRWFFAPHLFVQAKGFAGPAIGRTKLGITSAQRTEIAHETGVVVGGAAVGLGLTY